MMEPEEKKVEMGLTNSKDSHINPSSQDVSKGSQIKPSSQDASKGSKKNSKSESNSKKLVESSESLESHADIDVSGKDEPGLSKGDNLDEVSPIVEESSLKVETNPPCPKVEETSEVESSAENCTNITDKVESTSLDSPDSSDKIDTSDNADSQAEVSKEPLNEEVVQLEVNKESVLNETDKEKNISLVSKSESGDESIIIKEEVTSLKKEDSKTENESILHEGGEELSKVSLCMDEKDGDIKVSEDTPGLEDQINLSVVDDKLNDSENAMEVGDVSVRSRYGRAHKPKPLIDGFLTTDRKVGAFLGHSPQNSPRKKDDPLRFSLKGIKKSSPPKINPEEAVIAVLKSLQDEKDGKSSTLLSKVRRGRGRPRKVNKQLPQVTEVKSLPTDDPDTSVFSPCIKKLFSEEDDKLVKQRESRVRKSVDGGPRTRTSVIKTEDKEDVKKEVEDMTAEMKNTEEDVNKELEKPNVSEAIAEKESDSGVESSGTTPTSEPEDGVSSKEEQTLEKVNLSLTQGKWSVGDLVWGHIKGHPFWPCIVVHEPDQGIYMKTWRNATTTLFHVRFFGDNARRSWISYKHIIEFNSAEDYLKLMEEYPDRKKDFEVSSRNIPKWKFAIQEAEKLASLSRSDRLETFTKMYPHVLKDGGEEGMKKSAELSSTITPKRGKKRRYPSSSPSSSENETPNKSVNSKELRVKKHFEVKRKRIKKSITPFEAFSAKFRERIIDEHPDLKSEEIDQMLSQRWEMLEDTVKAGYDLRSNEGSSDGIKSSDEDDELAREGESETSGVSKVKVKPMGEKRRRPRRSLAAKENVAPIHGGLFKGLKMDKVCIQCEKPGGELFKCKGVCLRFFHPKCAPEKSKGIDGSEEFRCGDCVVDGKPPCAACWKEEVVIKGDDERKKCSQNGCGRFYHEECLARWPQAWWTRQTFTCPAHCCHTCASDDPRESRMHTSHTEKLVRCVRCPATYHSGDYCLPAGSIVLTGSQILCQRHYQIPKKGYHHSNTSWCFICSKGGYLICCDRCPSSFHPQCLNITAPEGSYICEDCDSARYPLHGEVVWVKLGRYRWWPAQILYPREVPENVQQLPHSLGEFPVRFFGSHDHFWVNNGRAFLYQAGDSAKTAPPKSGTDALFARALQEAAVYYEKRAKEKAEWDAANIAGRNNCMKPPQFVRIKTNKPVGDVKPFEVVHGDSPCDCDPKIDKPCSQEPNCLNRMLMVECDPNVCRAGERCCNQRFQKRQYPPLATCRTEGRGWGLKTLADLSQGEFVIEYVGEMINEAECHRRIERMHRLKDENYYFLTIDRDHILDAGPKGNLSRFMNHSCSPNCETQKWTVGGETRVGLFALCDIPAGSELTFNYNLQVIGTERRPCLCGSANCIRFIGAKTKSEQEESNGNRSNTPEVPAKKLKLKGKKTGKSSKLLNQVCQKCSHGGELITCTVKTCGKLYHPSCVQLSEEPTDKWTCPTHHCAQCKGKPNFHCSECSFSFCSDHMAQDVVGKTSITCAEHIKQESKQNGSDKEISDEKPKESVSETIKDEEKGEVDNVKVEDSKTKGKVDNVKVEDSKTKGKVDNVKVEDSKTKGKVDNVKVEDSKTKGKVDNVKVEDSKTKGNAEEKAQTPRQRALQRKKLGLLSVS